MIFIGIDLFQIDDIIDEASMVPPQNSDNQRTQIDDKNDKDDYKPIDVDVNLVKNILESYSAQQGLPGPVTNILRSMNIQIPDNSEK